MKLTKSVLSVFLTAFMLIGTLVIPASAVSLTALKKELTQYTTAEYHDSKSSKDTYNFKIKNNSKNYIKVTLVDVGSSYRLSVKAKKATTDKDNPVLTVYKEKNGKTTEVKKYSFTVNKPEKKTFSNININVKMTKEKTLTNPYYKDYSFTYDKKIAKINTAYTAKGTKVTYKIKALKKGSTKVKVFIKGTGVKAGTFKITAGDFPTKLRDKYKTLELKYNAHGSSTYMKDSHVKLNNMLKDRKHGAVYSVAIDNEKIATSLIDKKKTTVYSAGKGETEAKVYQKIGDKEETEIASFKIKVKKAKMNYVAKQNMLFFNDGIFGSGEMVEFLSPNESFTMKDTIVKSLINNTYTGSHFKKSLYKITYKSTDKSVVTVNKDGKVTAKKVGNAVVNYTITFSDDSKFHGGCPIEVWESADRPDRPA